MSVMDGCPTINLERLLVLSVALFPMLATGTIDNDAQSSRRIDEQGSYKRIPIRDQRQHKLSERLTLAENYLIKYGYLDNVKHIPRKERRHAILSFQHYNGLRETGKLNRRTVRKMAEPRCGIPDDVHPEVKRRKRRQASYSRGWPQKVITWKPTSYSRKLPIFEQWKTLKIAFQTWADVIPKHFKYTIENPDIVIKFARGIHGDGDYNGFDGRGMTLAHAFRPGNHPMSGDTHFDDDEDWSRDGRGTRTNPDLLAVATHEFGHAIGLDHSADYNSIMSPYFSASRTELTYSDIRAAQMIYGSRVKRPPRRNSVTRRTTNNPEYSTTSQPLPRYTPRTTTTTPSNIPRDNSIPERRPRYRSSTTQDTPTLTKLPKCQGVDAMFIGQDGDVSIIVNETLFQVDKRTRSYQTLALRSVYPNAPIPVGAAVYIKGRLYLFKDNHVWRYTKQKLDYRFPKEIYTHTNGEFPRAAINTNGYRSRRIYLFGKTKFWEWSIWDDDVIGQKQHDIKRFWKGVPSSPDAALTWRDQAIYFVKNDKYYKVSQRSRTLSRRYPKQMPAPWMRNLCENN